MIDRALGTEFLSYAVSIDQLATPEDVLNNLHSITWEHCQINVLGAVQFPMRWGDWSGLEKGKTVFLHKSVPAGWFDEYLELSQKNYAPGLMMAKLALAPFTKSEEMRMLEPLGVDRWPHELALKYGARDGLMCPVGGRWVVSFWSSTVLSERLGPEVRALLFMAANFAAIRLQKLTGLQAKRVGKGVLLTPRELAVLRLLSTGQSNKDAAAHLGLGEETVRSHLKKAQAKLGVHNRAHAVAQAIRQHLIP